MPRVPVSRQRRRWATRGNAAWVLAVVGLLGLVPAVAPALLGSSSSPARPGSLLGDVGFPPNQTTYNVTFIEVGLPSGTSWSVSLNGGGGTGTSTSSTIVFQLSNSTYNFNVGSVAGYIATPSSGSVTVAGSDVNQTIAWSPTTYTLTLTESGLPAGTGWAGTANGQPDSAFAPAVLTFTLTSPTYSFHVWSTNTTWGPSPSSGSGTLSGTSPPIPITFSLVVFHAKFVESNLPSGTLWTVSVAGSSPVSSTTNMITVSGLVNGTYTYGATSSNQSWATSPSSFSISGGNATVSVPFVKQTYPVSFVQSGLPTGTLWSVTLAGTSQPSSYSTITFYQPNGTYGFSVASIPGWADAPSSGNVTVTGHPVTVTIVWARALYNVTFNESGITTNTRWWVNLSGPTGNASHPGNTALGTTISLGLPNGTYSYTIASNDKRWEPTVPRGSFLVNGANLVIGVTFVEILNPVTFSESGLPAGLEWWANVSGGYSNSSVGTTLAYQLPNGSYTYRIQAANRSWAAPGGNFSVAGAPVSILVTFTNILYPVTFNQTGLAASTNWSVTFAGSTLNASNGGSITFRVPNGTAAYSVVPLAGYVAKNGAGNVTVRGHPVFVTIAFLQATYTVLFNATNVTNNIAAWWVNVSWTNQTPVGSFEFTLDDGTISLRNGTYAYTVASATKSWVPQVPSSLFTVNGSNLVIQVNFVPALYSVTFSETGLPAGAQWTVFFAKESASSVTSTVVFAASNGTYNFSVGSLGVYTPRPSAGYVSVNGTSTAVSVNFAAAGFVVTFTETGLASGQNWSVTLNAVTKSTTGTSIVFSVGNGTFPYSVSSSGGSAATPSAGWVTVSGAGTLLSVHFGGTAGGGNLTTSAWAVLVGLIVMEVILVAVVLIVRRRHRAPPMPPRGAVAPDAAPSGAPSGRLPPSDKASTGQAR